MSTLIIHPSDKSTDFLSKIYEGTDWTIIRGGSSSSIKKAIKSHSRIVCMGHGYVNGLFNGKKNGYVVDSKLVYLLREKKDIVFLWCYSDYFHKKYALDGVASGMIISETSEAEYLGIPATEDEIEQSNCALVDFVRKYLLGETPSYIPTNPTMEFNKENLWKIS